MAPLYNFLQSGSGHALPAQRGPELQHREPDPKAAPADLPELMPELPLQRHAKEYIGDGDSWRFKCVCGYVSLPYCSQAEAMEHPCEIEVLLAESQERLRRLYRRAV